MPVEVGMWRIRDRKPARMRPTGVPLERDLEDYIVEDPELLGERLLLIGRQVPTGHGGFIDLLAIDQDGTLHVLELKRAVTPREVVAQTLDYGSWVTKLGYDDIVAIHQKFRDTPFEAAFETFFGAAPPDELNTEHRLTIMASSADAATERIVEYLTGQFSVPINVALFRYFEDGAGGLLVRTWLREEEPTPSTVAVRPKSTLKEKWNGTDWYVSFGAEPGGRSWVDATEYGFVSAGGGEWYSRSLRNLPVGARVFTYIPQSGYVGVGVTSGEARRFDQATVLKDGTHVPLISLPLHGDYEHPGQDEDQGLAEWVVPVDWMVTLPADQAIREPGLFANQNSACKLRNKFTLSVLYEKFGVANEEEH